MLISPYLLQKLVLEAKKSNTIATITNCSALMVTSRISVFLLDKLKARFSQETSQNVRKKKNVNTTM